MPKYKLIAVDLDGSLLQNNSEVSQVNRDWIKKAEAAGIIVSFATGRGRSSSHQFWDVVNPSAPMVVVNGAEVWRNHETLHGRHFLPPNSIPRLHELAVKHNTWYWAHVPNGLIRKEAWKTDYDSNSEFLKFGIATEDKAVISHLRELIEGWDEFEVTSSNPTNLEISKKGVSKGAALAEIAMLLEIDPSEVVTMGDSLNDLEMIKWAGLGVAMGNAEEPIKAVADYITGTNEENGVAQVIQLILE